MHADPELKIIVHSADVKMWYTIESVMKKTSKKAVRVEVDYERLFSGKDDSKGSSPVPQTFPLAKGVRFVQSVTTYSACEEPVPSFHTKGQ